MSHLYYIIGVMYQIAKQLHHTKTKIIRDHSSLEDNNLNHSRTHHGILHDPYIVVPVLDLGGCEYNKGELTYVHRSTSCGE
jgi:hypothetical protein